MNAVNLNAPPQQTAFAVVKGTLPWLPGCSVTVAKMARRPVQKQDVQQKQGLVQKQAAPSDAQKQNAGTENEMEALPWVQATVSNSPEQKALSDFSPPPLIDTALMSRLQSSGGQILTKRGKIGSITMPSHWVQTAGKVATQALPCWGQRDSFSPPNNSHVHVDVDCRRQPISEEYGQALLRLLKRKPADKGRQVLLPNEIRSVSGVLAFSAPLHNNQFAPLTVPAAFHLFEASTMKVNGETVLYVEGSLSLEGVETSCSTIFVAAGSDSETGSVMIQDVTMQGPPGTSFEFRRTFKSIIASIKWRH